MKRNALAFSIIALALLPGAGSAQQYEGYLDVFICRVKPDKRADFDAVGKKVADANRRHKGSAFIASQIEYGEQNTVTFTAARTNYAAIETATSAFESAMKEAYGPAMGQIYKDFDNTLASSRGELRRRRGELSVHLPADMASILKMVGESRWVRTVTIQVKQGRVDEFEAQWKAVKEGIERHGPGPTILASQSSVGQQGPVFYFTSYRKSLADFDKTPPLREVLGEEGYSNYQKGNAENVARTEITLSRFLPELSNPPQEVADASPEFWKPKAAVAPKTKAKPSDATKPAE